MGDLLRRGQGHQLTTALQSVRHIRIVWGQGRVVAGDEAFLQAQDDAAKLFVVGQLPMESLFKLMETAFKLGNGGLRHKTPR